VPWLAFRLHVARHPSLDKAQSFKSPVPNTNTQKTAHHLSKVVKAAVGQNAAAPPEQQKFNVDMVRELTEMRLRRFHQNLGKNTCVCLAVNRACLLHSLSL